MKPPRIRPRLAVVSAVVAVACLAGYAWGQRPPSGSPRADSPSPDDASDPSSLELRVSLRLGDGTSVPASDAVVWTAGPPTAGDPASGVERSLSCHKGELVPRVRVLRAGRRLRFLNRDGGPHNLFTPDGSIDVDLKSRGESVTVRLESPGHVPVYCNDHPDEASHVVVVEAGVWGQTDTDGLLRLSSVEPGNRTLELWHEKSGRESIELELLPGERRLVEVELDVSGWQPSPHNNKHGKDYPPPPGDLSVRVLRLEKPGLSVPAPDAVVWLEDSPRPALEVRLGRSSQAAQVAARSKRFTPRVVAVPVHSSVDFPNHDRIHHNVFSLSRTKSFDLGLYRDGSTRSVRFDLPGVVKVYCNIHPRMAAYVIVVDGKNHALTGPEGRASLKGIPPGDWTLRVWDEKGGEWKQPVRVGSGRAESVEVRLDTSGWSGQAHKNKYGEDYPPPDDEDSRY